MTDGVEADETPPASRSKVGRVIEKYQLDGLAEELVAYWTGEYDERYSLRQLADYFNREVLRAALADAGENPLDGEVDNTYRLITDADVSEGMRTQAERRIERLGIDVDALASDFVSHQAIHTYLTKYQQVSYPGADDDVQLAKDRERIDRLENRLVAVIEDALSRSRSTDRLALSDFDVFVDTRVMCEECGTTYTVSDLVDRGGCDCQLES